MSSKQRGLSTTRRAVAFGWLLNALMLSALPLAEAWHDHAPGALFDVHIGSEHDCDAPPADACVLTCCALTPAPLPARSAMLEVAELRVDPFDSVVAEAGLGVASEQRARAPPLG